MENTNNNNFAILALVAIVAVIGVVSLVMMMNSGSRYNYIAQDYSVADSALSGQAVTYIDGFVSGGRSCTCTGNSACVDSDGASILFDGSCCGANTGFSCDGPIADFDWSKDGSSLKKIGVKHSLTR